MSAADRRAELQQRIHAETGIDEAMIAGVVHGFYDRVRADPLLSPVFAARLAAPTGRRISGGWCASGRR